MRIRAASLADLDRLVALEQRCFSLDRLSRRSFRHLLTRGHAEILLCEIDARLCGYLLLLFRRGAPWARLYSIATDPDCRGRGIADRLVRAAEAQALAREASLMRLEIRTDNSASIRLFGKLGYQVFSEYAGYYEDGQNALRLQKRLPGPALA